MFSLYIDTQRKARWTRLMLSVAAETAAAAAKLRIDKNHDRYQLAPSRARDAYPTRMIIFSATVRFKRIGAGRSNEKKRAPNIKSETALYIWGLINLL